MARFSGNRHYVVIFGKRLPTWVVAIEVIFVVGALVLAPFALFASPTTGAEPTSATPSTNSGTPIPTPTRAPATRFPTATPSGGSVVSGISTPTVPATRRPPSTGTVLPPVLAGNGIGIRDWRWEQTGDTIRVSGTIVNLQEAADGPVEVHAALLDCLLAEELHANWENSVPQTLPPGGTATFDVPISGNLFSSIDQWDAVRFSIRTWKGEVGASTFGCVGGKPAAGITHSWTSADELPGAAPLPTPLPTISLVITPTPTFGSSPSTQPTTPTQSQSTPPAATPGPFTPPTPTPTLTPTPTPFPDGVHVIQWQWDPGANNTVLVSGFVRNFGAATESPVEVHVALIDCGTEQPRYTAWEMASPQSIGPGQTASFQVSLQPELFAAWEPWDALQITLRTFSGPISQASTRCSDGQPPSGDPRSF